MFTQPQRVIMSHSHDHNAMQVKTIIMVETVQFGKVDFAVFGIMLFLSTAIGIYHALTGGKQRTTKEFLFANRGMMAIPVALSLIASFMSAITILGVPAEVYIYGTQYWLIIASYVILFPSVALVFVPVFRAVDISSSYEVRKLIMNRNADHISITLTKG